MTNGARLLKILAKLKAAKERDETAKLFAEFCGYPEVVHNTTLIDFLMGKTPDGVKIKRLEGVALALGFMVEMLSEEIEIRPGAPPLPIPGVRNLRGH